MAPQHSFRIVVTSLLPGLPMRSCHPQLRSELLPLLPYNCSPNGPTTQCRIPFFICTHKYNAENIPPLSQASAFPLILPSLFMSCIDRTWKATSPIRIYRKSVLSLIGLGMGMIHYTIYTVCGIWCVGNVNICCIQFSSQ